MMDLVSAPISVLLHLTATPACSAAPTGVSAWMEKLTALKDLLVMLSVMEAVEALPLPTPSHQHHAVNALELNSAKLDKCPSATTAHLFNSKDTTPLAQAATNFALNKMVAITS